MGKVKKEKGKVAQNMQILGIVPWQGTAGTAAPKGCDT
jgi:hypothetical protein